jgi:hypothetical protein
MDHGLWIKAVLNRPPSPHARDCGSGIDQHAIQVKEQGTAADLDHLSNLHCRWKMRLRAIVLFSSD